MKKVIKSTLSVVAGFLIGGVFCGVIDFCVSHRQLANYAEHQKQQLQDSIEILNDSLRLYEEWFYQAVD